jgi:hypothetical protein
LGKEGEDNQLLSWMNLIQSIQILSNEYESLPTAVQLPDHHSRRRRERSLIAVVARDVNSAYDRHVFMEQNVEKRTE